MVIKEDFADGVGDVVDANWLNGSATIVNEVSTNGLKQKLKFEGTIVNHAGLQVKSLTTTERDALTPVNGDLIYNETLNKFQKYENGAWINTGINDLLEDTTPELGGDLNGTGKAILLTDNDTSLLNNMIKLSTSQSTPGASVNPLLIESTNAAFDRPLVRINDVSTAGGAASIRLDSPNPDIEFVETDQVSPAGKYELAGQGDAFQLNGRNSGDSSFENFIEFHRLAKDPSDMMIVKHNSTSPSKNFLTLRNAAASAGAHLGIMWENTAGSIDMARLSAKAGSSYQDSALFVEVADSTKALQQRYTFDSKGNLTADSVTGTMIVANVTTTERNAMTGINGMIVYNTTDNQFNFYENGSWVTK